MDARRWLGLEPTHNSHRYFLPVTPGVSVGHRFLFGGCALGAAIAALESTAERPVVWATAQYLGFATTGTVMDIDVTIAVDGHATTQARAVGHVGGREILTVNAALGSRSLDYTAQHLSMPEVQGPEGLPERPAWSPGVESINNRMDQRWAIPPGADPERNEATLLEPGRVAMWVRMPELLEPGAATLAVLGDYVPMGVRLVAGQELSGNSLDNTLRVLKIVPTEWFLVDIRIDGVTNGFGHGSVHLWSQDGTLMGIGSQSATVRDRVKVPEASQQTAQESETQS